MVTHSLINSFIVSRKDDEITFHREFVSHVLVEAFTVRRGKNHFVVVALRFQCCNATVDGFTLHHHACRPSIRVVVHSAPFVERIVTQVVQSYFGQPFFLCSGQYAFVDEAFQHFG